MRQIVLDTETTGLEPSDGHRIIEIGCVELINRRVTENHYHVYLNPDREVDQGAIEVHGLTNEFLADKPRFEQIVETFLAFIQGADLVIHNAPFDVGFIDHELSLLNQKDKNKPYLSITEYCSVTDTLMMARRAYPGQRNSLDALCKRLEVDNSQRTLHGALLDAEILADVYLLMTGGQENLLLDEEADAPSGQQKKSKIRRIANKKGAALTVIKATEQENQAHELRLAAIKKHSGQCLWEAS